VRAPLICSGPDDGELRIAVKKVDGGAFSGWAADELKPGDELDVATPTGRFGVAPRPARRALCRLRRRLRHHADPVDHKGRGWRAAGQPVLFVLRQSLEAALFLEALEELKDRFIERLSLFHVISGEEQDPDFAWKARWREGGVLRSLVPHRASIIFICGPTGMSEDIEATCRTSASQPTAFRRRFVTGARRQAHRPRFRRRRAPRALAALIIDGAPRGAGREGEAILVRRCAPAWICRSPARAACARPAAPLVEARRR
jgi:ring-1,2-phenylacetyl-CoA epoxidase subunit PaaE